MAYQHQHFGSVNPWNATRCSPESTSFIQSGGESERFSPLGYASPMGHIAYPVNNLGLRQPTNGYCPQEGAMHLPVSLQHPYLANNTSWSQAPRLGVYSPEQLQQARSIAHFSPGVKVETYCNQSVVEQHFPSLSCSTEYPAIDQRFQIQNFEREGQTESEKRSVQYLRQAAMQKNEQTVLPKSLYFSHSSSWAEFYRKFLNYARDKQWSSQECKTYMGYVLEGKAAEYFHSVNQQEPELPYYDLLNKMEDFMKLHYSQGVMSPVKPCPSETLTDTQEQYSTPSHMHTYKHNPLSPNMFQEPHSSSSCESFGGTARYSYCDTPQTLHSSFLRNQSIDTDIVSNCKMKYQNKTKDSLTYIGKAEECKSMKRQRYVRYTGSSKSEPVQDYASKSDIEVKPEDQTGLCDRMTHLETMFKSITQLADSKFLKEYKLEKRDSALWHDTKKPSLHDQHSSTLHDPKRPTSKHAQISKALHDPQTPLQSTLQNEKGRPGSFNNELFKQEQSSKTRIKSEEAEQRIQSLENYADWLDDLSNQLVVTSTPKGESSRLLPEYGEWSPEEFEWSENGENSSLQLLFSETSNTVLSESPAATANGAQAFQQESREPCSVFTHSQESNSEKQEFWWDSLETRGIRAEDEADSLASCEQFIDGMYIRLFGHSTPHSKAIETCTSEEHETWLDQKFADTFHSVSLQESCLKDKEVRETEIKEETKSLAAQQEQTNTSLHGVTAFWPTSACKSFLEEGNQSPSFNGNPSQISFGTVTTCQDQTSSSLKVPVIVQGIVLNAVIDTAAMVTVISDKLYKEMAVKPESLKTAVLKTAGSDQKINGQVVGPVSMKLGESVYSVLVHVAPIYEDMLLGLNFLIEHGLEINVTEQYLLVRQNKERIPLEISASPRKGCAASKVTIERVVYIQDSPTTLVKYVPLQERAACSLYQPENKKSHFTSTRFQWDSSLSANLQQTGSCDPGYKGKQFNMNQIGSSDPKPSNVQSKATRLAIGFHAHTVEIMTVKSKQKSEYVSNYSCQHSSDLKPQKLSVKWVSEDEVTWPWDPGGEWREDY